MILEQKMVFYGSYLCKIFYKEIHFQNLQEKEK